MPFWWLEYTQSCDLQFSASKKINAPLATLILQQSEEFYIPFLYLVKSEICQLKQQLLNSSFNDIKSHLNPDLQHIVDLITVKCSSLCPSDSGTRLSYEQARIPRCSMFKVHVNTNKIYPSCIIRDLHYCISTSVVCTYIGLKSIYWIKGC